MNIQEHSKNSTILGAAAWFGLVTGLLEGTGQLLWNTRWAITVEIIWICAALDLFLFLLLAGALLGTRRLFPRLPIIRWGAALFAFLGFLDLLLLSGRIRHLPSVILAGGLTAVYLRWFQKREARVICFWRATLPWVAATAALAFATIEGGSWLRERWSLAHLPAARPGSPNILVIVMDTVRADHLSGYGYSRATSPNIDRLAQQGILFENAIPLPPGPYPLTHRC